MVEGFSIVGFLNQLVDKHEESWIDAKYVNLIFSSILPTFKTRPRFFLMIFYLQLCNLEFAHYILMKTGFYYNTECSTPLSLNMPMI